MATEHDSMTARISFQFHNTEIAAATAAAAAAAAKAAVAVARCKVAAVYISISLNWSAARAVLQSAAAAHCKKK